jgi:ABC-type multidrug transport system fused ATPase/permease subunit
MDAGRVVEYDAPDVLLKNEDSIFSGLVREMRERASGN